MASMIPNHCPTDSIPDHAMAKGALKNTVSSSAKLTFVILG